MQRLGGHDFFFLILFFRQDNPCQFIIPYLKFFLFFTLAALELLVQRSPSKSPSSMADLASHLPLSSASSRADCPLIYETLLLLASGALQYPSSLLLQWSVFAVFFLPLLLFTTSTSVTCQDPLPVFFFPSYLGSHPK